MTEQEIIGTATFIQKLPRPVPYVDARLFRLSVPLRGYGSRATKATYVVVSASCAPGLRRPETYIFAATRRGTIRNWLEMPGSFQGAMDHVRALNDAGYRVVIEGSQD